MAVLLTAIASFLVGIIAGWVITSAYATTTMGRLVDRKQREIRDLQDEVVLLRAALRSSRAKGVRGTAEWEQAS
ncbi:hypothetical protein CLV63_120111 [Murinocardiopsis flavida]|uniref:Uncharacterized protein n=1 Tax=Murinocardiopsis flavida TaxID=645275 RepID=A0A2P8D2D2_9ACTN|nr:hypothetical protein [Murinocardiopsis flavida]PSK91384.1 hypothetical protein CLV63_120111 [Murinocardiopsis flavida]